jgi:hypothetical protein
MATRLDRCGPIRISGDLYTIGRGLSYISGSAHRRCRAPTSRLIADEQLQRGTVDHTPVYPREVVKRALELSATAIILVHKIPTRNPIPLSSCLFRCRRPAA